MRLALQAEIPNLREQRQTLLDDLSANSAEQENLNKQLDQTRGGAGTPEMLRLKTQHAELSLTIEDFNGAVQRAEARRDRAQQMEKTLRVTKTETETQIRKMTDEISALRDEFDEKSLELDRLQMNATASVEKQNLVLRSAESALQDFNQVLEGRERTEEDSVRLATLQTAVREAQAKSGQIEIDEMLSDKLTTARADVTALKLRIQAKEAELTRSQLQREATNEQMTAAERDVNAQQDLLDEAIASRDRATREFSALELRIKGQADRDAQNSTSETALEAALDKLRAEERNLTEQLAAVELKLPDANTKLIGVENEINTLLIPRSAENEFKRDISTSFTWLVGIVIVLFFFLALWDPKMRQVVFSAEAGIQFVTLFSLVIAIILFGITGILEGKELSALLGGISGYILGRGSSPSPRPSTV